MATLQPFKIASKRVHVLACILFVGYNFVIPNEADLYDRNKAKQKNRRSSGSKIGRRYG